MNELFIPYDAYTAALLDGIVVDDLSNPAAIPTVIAVFDFNEEKHTAIYHSSIDKWEMVDEDDLCLVGVDTDLYQCAISTVDKFADKLLSGPCYKYLTDVVLREFHKAEDARILASLSALLPSETPNAPSEKLELAFPLADTKKKKSRKLKVRWSKDDPIDHRLRSRLICNTSSSC